jgi:hypothetical protein
MRFSLRQFIILINYLADLSFSILSIQLYILKILNEISWPDYSP